MNITKTCNTCEHYPNDNHCIGCEWDKSKGENTKWELKNNPIVIERKVLDKIRDEIEHLTITEGGEDYTRKMAELYSLKIKVLQIIDKYRKGEQE